MVLHGAHSACSVRSACITACSEANTHNLLWVPDAKLDRFDALHRRPAGREAVHGGRHGAQKLETTSCSDPLLLQACWYKG